jgi:hypothetical protein
MGNGIWSSPRETTRGGATRANARWIQTNDRPTQSGWRVLRQPSAISTPCAAADRLQCAEVGNDNETLVKVENNE